jgi:hypothetical protein
MNKNPEPSTRPAAAGPQRPPATAHRPRRIPVAALLNTGALLATTALLLAAEPKSPPFKGD